MHGSGQRGRGARGANANDPAFQLLASSRVPPMVLLALSLLGFAVSVYLTYVHYRLHADPSWHSACGIGEVVGCDNVLLSEYGTIGRFPVSALAIWYYVATGGLALALLRGERRRFPRSPAALFLVLAWVATVMSLVLAILSAAALRSFCPLCTSLYVVNVTALIVAWRTLRATRERLSVALGRERRYWKALPGRAFSWAGAATLLLLALLLPYRRGTSGGSLICEAMAAARTSGEPATMPSLVIYTDFQCPSCRDLDADLRVIRRELPIIHRHFPIDIACNNNVRETRHAGSCLQARAAICADGRGRYDVFSDQLFDRFDAAPTTKPALVELASAIGLNQVSFATCLDDPQTHRLLSESVDAGARDGIRVTPSLLLNGRRHEGRLSEADLKCLRSGIPNSRSESRR